MFRFASPYYLAALAAIPLSIYWQRSRQTYPVMGIPVLATVRDVKRSVYLKMASTLSAIKFAAIFLVVIAMARPQWGTQQVTVPTEGINIILAVDLSESMAALDFKQADKVVNRLEAAKSVINDFISKRIGDRIGMVVFGTHAYTQIPLTRDYNTISTVLERLKIGSAGKNTAIGDAIGISLKRLKDIKSKTNIIILLTDGQSNTGELAPQAATEIASQEGIKIYTVGVGSKGKAPFLIQDPLFGDRYVYQRVDIDEDTLKEISRKTGALYFRAEDTQGLIKIYETIDRLEKTTVKVKTFAEYRDLYLYFLAPAFMMMAMWITLTNTRFLRIP